MFEIHFLLHRGNGRVEFQFPLLVNEMSDLNIIQISLKKNLRKGTVSC